MFTSLLPEDNDFRIFISKYAEHHFLNDFERKYKGKRWSVTRDSIFQDLKRIYYLQLLQQVDELKHGTDCKLFKYDFTIAQSGISPKASGNRCIIFLDIKARRQDILLIYSKNDLPKNMSENQYIYKTVADQFKELWEKLN